MQRRRADGPGLRIPLIGAIGGRCGEFIRRVGEAETPPIDGGVPVPVGED
jgi:hypothetical protein